MACGTCRGGSNRHGGTSRGLAELRKMAFLNPQQLELLEQLEAEEAKKKAEENK